MRRSRASQAMDAAVRELYGALGEEMRLDAPLHRLGAVFRSHISGLHTEDFGAHRGRLTISGEVSSEEFAELSEAYSSRWSGQNLWMERSLDGFLSQGWQHGDAVVGADELRRSPYYRHFLKPLDIRHGLGICLWSGDHDIAVASFHRSHADTGFATEDFRRIEALHPHLVNAYAIYRRIAGLEDEIASFRACFESSAHGMLMLGAHGRVLEINAAAQEALNAAGMTITRGGSLTLPGRQHQNYIVALRALAAARPEPARSIVFEHAPPGQAPQRYVLHLCAVPPRTLGGTPVGTAILGFLAALDSKQSGKFDQAVLRGALNVTRAEARVLLCLRRHPDVSDVARVLGASPATVRAHLRSLHARLGIRRNAALLQVVERLIGSLPRT